MKDIKDCAWCKKSNEESPRREFPARAGGGLVGVCIECEKEHERKVDTERVAQGLHKFEILYSKTILCSQVLWAKSTQEAQEAVREGLKVRHLNELIGFKIHSANDITDIQYLLNKPKQSPGGADG